MKAPKFSIRDLLSIAVIVALSLGWWQDRSNLASLTRTQAVELAMKSQETAKLVERHQAIQLSYIRSRAKVRWQLEQAELGVALCRKRRDQLEAFIVSSGLEIPKRPWPADAE